MFWLEKGYGMGQIWSKTIFTKSEKCEIDADAVFDIKEVGYSQINVPVTKHGRF